MRTVSSFMEMIFSDYSADGRDLVADGEIVSHVVLRLVLLFLRSGKGRSRRSPPWRPSITIVTMPFAPALAASPSRRS